MKKIHYIILGLLIVLSTSFLIFQQGVWIYLDNGSFFLNLNKLKEYLYSSLLTLNGSSYFGFDISSLYSTRLVQIAVNSVGMKSLFFLFFVFCFLSGYKLLSIRFSKLSSFYGALFFTFNPVSIYFLQQTGFIFSYLSAPLIIISIYYYIEKGNLISIVGSILGFYFLFSYTRIAGIYGIFLIFLALFYYKNIWFFFSNSKKKTALFLSIHILASLPFLGSFLLSYLYGESAYFSGLGNYASSSIDYGTIFYQGVKNESFLNSFIIRELNGNFSFLFQDTILFKVYSFLFFVIITISSVFLAKNKNSGFILYLLSLLLVVVFVRMGGKFLDQENFINLVYVYFPFLSNNTNWVYIIYILIFSYLISFIMQNCTIAKNKYLQISVYFYILLSILPLILFQNNTKLQTIKNIPVEYINTFFGEGIEKNSSLFFPASLLYFKWTDYPIEILNNTLYQETFNENIRLVNKKQSSTAAAFKGGYSIDIYNRALFNLKNVFVFKDIQNSRVGQFDFFPVRDYISESELYYKELRNNANLYIKDDTQNFVHFGVKDDNSYEYFVYAPGVILQKDTELFFSESINIREKPINIDPKSFNKPNIINNFTIPKENKNISIAYKRSVLNPTKIYAKIENVDTSKEFLIQLNQTFGMSWKIKWISESDFREKTCVDNFVSYSITQNKFCDYRAQILDLSGTKYLSYPSIPDKYHFEGNFVGNAWLISPLSIPPDMKNKRELYAIIIYEKQIWYSLALLISFSTFFGLIFSSIVQEVYLLRKRRNGK